MSDAKQPQFWETWNAVDFARYKAMHKSTVEAGAESFHFTWQIEGQPYTHEFIVGYAKYLIEYLSTTKFR